MLKAFSHFTIKSPDVKTSAQWYCDKLGFTKSYIADDVCAALSHPQLGGLGIYTANTKTPIDRGAGIFFRCDNIQKTVSELRSKGIEVDDPIQYSSGQNWFSFFYDIDGNKIGIME